MMGNMLLIIMHFRQLYDDFINSYNEEWGLKPLETNLILFLAMHADFNTARDFCRMRIIPKSNASNTIRSLMRKDLLRFETDPEDKKINRLYLTEKAQPIAELLVQKQAGFIELIKEAYTDEELINMHGFIQRMDTHICRELKRRNYTEEGETEA